MKNKYAQTHLVNVYLFTCLSVYLCICKPFIYLSISMFWFMLLSIPYKWSHVHTVIRNGHATGWWLIDKFSASASKLWCTKIKQTYVQAHTQAATRTNIPTHAHEPALLQMNFHSAVIIQIISRSHWLITNCKTRAAQKCSHIATTVLAPGTQFFRFVTASRFSSISFVFGHLMLLCDFCFALSSSFASFWYILCRT